MLHATIKDAEVTVLGQTSGEWVHLGQYTFAAGKQAYVEISNQAADADVIGDAVLLVPAKQ